MNELKPEDVMRALEHCSNGKGCIRCSWKGHLDGCIDALMSSALALLREKDAEIERLRAKANKWLEHLKAVLSERADHTEAVSEAITEFAERLKSKKIFLKDYNGNMCVVVRLSEIDQIAKGMKGDTNGEKEN